MVRSIPLAWGSFLTRCAVCCIPAPFAPHPPAPFSHTGRRGSLSVLMPETEDGTQGLPRAQGLQPARAPARQPRRGFPVLREGFSPHEQRRAPAQAGFALESRGLEPDGTRRIPDVLLTLHQPAISAGGRDARAPRTHVVRSCRPSLSAGRTPEPRRGFPALREGFSPHEQRRAPAQAGFALESRGLEPDGTRRIPDLILTLHQVRRK